MKSNKVNELLKDVFDEPYKSNVIKAFCLPFLKMFPFR
jgi:hypothetical protein